MSDVSMERLFGVESISRIPTVGSEVDVATRMFDADGVPSVAQYHSAWLSQQSDGELCAGLGDDVAAAADAGVDALEWSQDMGTYVADRLGSAVIVGVTAGAGYGAGAAIGGAASSGLGTHAGRLVGATLGAGVGQLGSDLFGDLLGAIDSLSDAGFDAMRDAVTGFGGHAAETLCRVVLDAPLDGFAPPGHVPPTTGGGWGELPDDYWGYLLLCGPEVDDEDSGGSGGGDLSDEAEIDSADDGNDDEEVIEVVVTGTPDESEDDGCIEVEIYVET